jgi:hypothetical protein
MTRVDRRVQKSQEAIKNAFIELMSEKTLIRLQYKIYPTEQMSVEEPFMIIIWKNLIYWKS